MKLNSKAFQRIVWRCTEMNEHWIDACRVSRWKACSNQWLRKRPQNSIARLEDGAAPRIRVPQNTTAEEWAGQRLGTDLSSAGVESHWTMWDTVQECQIRFNHSWVLLFPPSFQTLKTKDILNMNKFHRHLTILFSYLVQEKWVFDWEWNNTSAHRKY